MVNCDCIHIGMLFAMIRASAKSLRLWRRRKNKDRAKLPADSGREKRFQALQKRRWCIRAFHSLVGQLRLLAKPIWTGEISGLLQLRHEIRRDVEPGNPPLLCKRPLCFLDVQKCVLRW